MKEETNQTASRFLDHDLSSEDLGHLIKKLKQDPELTKRLNRYQMIGQVVQSERLNLVDDSFLAGIKEQVAKEPHYLRPQPRQPRVIQLPLVRKVSLAVAASVVLVMVLVGRNNQVAQDGWPYPLTSHEMVAGLEPIEETDSLMVARQERLQAYLQAHSNDIYTHGSLGIPTYGRMTGYGLE
jgi:hypothetical protein